VVNTRVNFLMTLENLKLSHHHNKTTTTITAHVVIVVNPDTSNMLPMVKSIAVASPILVVTAVTESPLAPKASKSSSSSSSSQQQCPLSYHSSGPMVAMAVSSWKQQRMATMTMTTYDAAAAAAEALAVSS